MSLRRQDLYRFVAYVLIIIIIIILRRCLWCCHHDKVTARVHLTNVVQCQAATNVQTKPTDLGCKSACMLHAQQPPLPFIITQPES